jgi:hypothetical protein
MDGRFLVEFNEENNLRWGKATGNRDMIAAEIEKWRTGTDS